MAGAEHRGVRFFVSLSSFLPARSSLWAFPPSPHAQTQIIHVGADLWFQLPEWELCWTQVLETLTHSIIPTSPVHYFLHFPVLLVLLKHSLWIRHCQVFTWMNSAGLFHGEPSGRTRSVPLEMAFNLTEGEKGPYLHTSKSLLPSDSLVSPPAWCENLILNSFKPFDLHKSQVTEHPILAVLRNAINPEWLPHRASGSLISQDLWAHIFFEGTQPTLKSQISLHMPAIYINKGRIKSAIYSFFSYQSNFFSHLHLCRWGNFQAVPFFG